MIQPSTYNFVLQGKIMKKTKSRKLVAEERKIKARAAISLVVLLRKGPEWIAL